jgi:hypothetical protein
MPLLRLSEPFFFDVVKQECKALVDKLRCRKSVPLGYEGINSINKKLLN